MDLALQPFRKYFEFKGRARRKEYWLFYLFITVLILALTLLDSVLGLVDYEKGVGLFSGLFSLAIFIPSITVSVRRLHDINKSGWWYLILVVPLVGIIVFLIFACMPGTNGSNRFGADPKAAQPELQDATV